MANTVGQSADGTETSSGWSFIRDPDGLPVVEAGFYEEAMITAVLDVEAATGRYASASARHPRFLRPYWRAMVQELRKRADRPVR